MANTVIQFRELLDDLEDDPTKRIDPVLLEDVKRLFQSDTMTSERRLQTLGRIVSVIPKLQQDPSPLADLTTCLLDSANRPSFLKIMSLEPEVDLVAGLQAPNEAINLLALRLLAEARTSADVGLVAGKSDAVAALVRLWLCTPSTAVAERAELVLASLLGAESPLEEDGGHGSVESFPTHEAVLPVSSCLMWRRIFKDRDIYGSIFSICSMITLRKPDQPDKTGKTIAQARLFGLLKHILYAPQIWESQIASVEAEYGVPSGAGLLDFALGKMVDWRDDVLMHISLIDFYTSFIAYDGPRASSFPGMIIPTTDAGSRSSLEVMQAAGLHERTMSYFLDPDPTDILSDYFYGPAAAYIASYANTYATHFREHAAQAVLRKASDALSSTRPSAWANARAPSHDIKLLAQIPRHIILGADSGAVVGLLPVKPASADALNALAHIFCGPSLEEEERDDEMGLLLETTPTFLTAERAAARVLYCLYVGQRPNFWKELSAAADLTANMETALAAIRLVHDIARSNWAPLPHPSPSSNDSSSSSLLASLPTESQLRSRCPSFSGPLPASGAIALITEPAIGVILPWLVSGPPPRPSITDYADPDAWRLAQAKHAILPDLRRRLEDFVKSNAASNGATEAGERHLEPPAAWNDVLNVLERRERMGPLGNAGPRGSMRVPNPEVGTMEL